MTANNAARVLIVEDDPIIALIMEEMVEDLGYLVVGPARTVEDGLALAGGDGLDFALLDFEIGDGDASSIAQTCADRAIPFAFTTGNDPVALRQNFPEPPIISKPVLQAELLSVLPAAAASGTLVQH